MMMLQVKGVVVLDQQEDKMRTTINLKEEYIKQIKAVGQHLIENAENILFDMETEHIREINIVSNIRCDGLPTVEINKSYIPREFLK